MSGFSLPTQYFTLLYVSHIEALVNYSYLIAFNDGWLYTS